MAIACTARKTQNGIFSGGLGKFISFTRRADYVVAQISAFNHHLAFEREKNAALITISIYKSTKLKWIRCNVCARVGFFLLGIRASCEMRSKKQR